MMKMKNEGSKTKRLGKQRRNENCGNHRGDAGAAVEEALKKCHIVMDIPIGAQSVVLHGLNPAKIRRI